MKYSRLIFGSWLLLLIFLLGFYVSNGNYVTLLSNPYMEKAIVGQAFSEMSVAKTLTHEIVASTDEWPTELPQGYFGETIEVQLILPNIIEATLTDNPEIPEHLVGKKFQLLFDRKTSRWTCKNGNPPLPYGSLPSNCIYDTQPPEGSSHWAIILFIIFSTPVLFIYFILNNPLVKPTQESPDKIKHLPLPLLSKLDFLLKFSFRRSATLAAAKINRFIWQQAIDFSQMTERRKSLILITKLRGNDQLVEGWNIRGTIYQWVFHQDSLISIERCLVLFPEPDYNIKNFIDSLSHTFQGNDVVVIIETNEERNQQLLNIANNKNNRFVVPKTHELTYWLLDFEPTHLFLQLLKNQLYATRISPYQTRGGIINASQFFGRDNELSIILDRELNNYLLIGGRQLGKTSLLKRIEASFKENPGVHCCYLSLRDHRLAQRLAAVCEFDNQQDLSATIRDLSHQFPNQKLMILVDEADLFVSHERQNQYQTLNEIRSLSDEGLCHFIFTGFWELYSSVMLDYQSPIRNFGEIIKIGELEHSACISMAEQPMAALGIQYESRQVITFMANSVGRRANLMSIACQFCLLALEDNANVITKDTVDQALASDAISDALAGWVKLTTSPAACRIDRIIVYVIVLKQQCQLGELVRLFKSRSIVVDVETINQSILRLKLAYIIKQNELTINFAIPLFQKQFLTDEVKILLREELASMK